jgi:hypothetical protein
VAAAGAEELAEFIFVSVSSALTALAGVEPVSG